MRIKTSLFVFFILAILLTACHKNSIAYIHQQDEINDSEFSKVLLHYKNCDRNKQKYDAAVFLLKNMPLHYSSRLYDNDSSTICSTYQNADIILRQAIKYTLLKDARKPVIYDTDCISASFIITHIDKKFKEWHSVPWGKDISFQDFCEYILPYRIGDEELSDIILDTASTLTKTLIRRVELCGTTQKEASSILLSSIYPSTAIFINGKVLDCSGNAFLKVKENRSICIPSAIDFVPYWSERNGGHYWCSILSSFSDYHPDILSEKGKSAKVYRITYSHNDYPVSHKEYIPQLFKTPFIKDVTDKYFKTFQVTIKARNDYSSKYCYLCVFNSSRWQPISWSSLKYKRANFEKIGCGQVYLPIIFNKSEEAIPINYPFIVEADGSIRILKPKCTQKEDSIQIFRKYPLTESKQQTIDHLIGLSISNSEHQPCFNKIITDADIPLGSYPSITLHIPKELSNNQVILSLDKGYCNIAEVKLYKDDFPLFSEHPTEARLLFDNDPLTYITLHPRKTYKFQTNEQITKIEIIAKNDDNYINIGDDYELLLFNEYQWQSIARLRATTNSLTFRGLPKNGLFLLKDHSKGKEERIFTIENGRQIFW